MRISTLLRVLCYSELLFSMLFLSVSRATRRNRSYAGGHEPDHPTEPIPA